MQTSQCCGVPGAPGEYRWDGSNFGHKDSQLAVDHERDSSRRSKTPDTQRDLLLLVWHHAGVPVETFPDIG